SGHLGTPGSSKRHHGLHGLDIGLMNSGDTAQLPLVLGGFLGEDVALERVASLDRPAAADLKALGSAFFGLHFRHDDFQMIYFDMSTGGEGTWRSRLAAIPDSRMA